MGFFSNIAGDLIGAGSSLLGGLLGSSSNRSLNSDNLANSREFAQSGIQWRVQDAKKAGVSPYAALGLPLGQGPSMSIGDNSLASGIADMGQSLGRAADAVNTRQERASQKAVDALRLERASLENELLRSQITQVNRAANPPLPAMYSDPGLVPGQAAVAKTVNTPLPVTPGSDMNPWAEPASITSVGYAKTPSGGLSIVQSKDMKERLEDDMIGTVEWYARNRLPNSGLVPPSRSEHPLPLTHTWSWDSRRQEYVPKLLPEHILRMMRRNGMIN